MQGFVIFSSSLKFNIIHSDKNCSRTENQSTSSSLAMESIVSMSSSASLDSTLPINRSPSLDIDSSLVSKNNSTSSRNSSLHLGDLILDETVPFGSEDDVLTAESGQGQGGKTFLTNNNWFTDMKVSFKVNITLKVYK